MRKELQHIEFIEQFLSRDLGEKELENIFPESEINDELLKEIEFFKDFQYAIKRDALKDQINTISDELLTKTSFSWLKWLFSFVMLILVSILIYFFIASESKNQTTDKNSTVLEKDVAFKKYKKPSDKSTILDATPTPATNAKTVRAPQTSIYTNNYADSSSLNDENIIVQKAPETKTIELIFENTRYMHYDIVPEEFRNLILSHLAYFPSSLTKDELVDSIYLANREVCYSQKYNSVLGVVEERNILSVSRIPYKTLYFVDQFSNPYQDLIINEPEKNYFAQTNKQGNISITRFKKSKEMNLILTNPLGEKTTVNFVLNRRNKQVVVINKAEFKGNEELQDVQQRIRKLSSAEYDKTYIRTQAFKKRANFLIQNNYSLEFLDLYMKLTVKNKTIPDEAILEAMNEKDRESYLLFLQNLNTKAKKDYELPIKINEKETLKMSRSQVSQRLIEIICIQ